MCSSFFAGFLATLLACGADKHDEWDSDDTDTADDMDVDGDGFTPNDGDCDDGNPNINPNADETPCDNIDQDCDGADITDQDGDGYTCPELGGDDCDDNNSAFHPGADDACGDFVDYDCDGDPECDCDGDGFDSVECLGGDCDDADAAINPDADDECYDGVDSDCVGNDDDDCDRDGYVDAGHGGDDCDDDDHTINPGEAETCHDGIDNDCTADTSDCDCDGDGYDAVSSEDLPGCDGDDCDDEDAAVYPAASEASADNLDNDCDGEVDEDAYCNRFYPTSNGTTASKEFSTLFFDGATYVEYDTLSAWDPSTGEATLVLDLSSSLGSYSIELSLVCDHGEVSTDGWAVTTSGTPLFDVSFTDARVDLPAEEDLVAGTTWTAAYTGMDASTGPLYEVAADFEVLGDEIITVTAGTFDAVVVQADYLITDLSLGFFDRRGTATYYYVEKLGLVYSEDIQFDGTVYDRRELVLYSGYYP